MEKGFITVNQKTTLKFYESNKIFIFYKNLLYTLGYLQSLIRIKNTHVKIN